MLGSIITWVLFQKLILRHRYFLNYTRGVIRIRPEIKFAILNQLSFYNRFYYLTTFSRIMSQKVLKSRNTINSTVRIPIQVELWNQIGKWKTKWRKTGAPLRCVRSGLAWWISHFDKPNLSFSTKIMLWGRYLVYFLRSTHFQR